MCVRVCLCEERVSVLLVFLHALALIERETEQKESNASSALLLRCLPSPAFVVVVVVCIFLPCFRAFNTIQQLHKTVCCV